MTGILPASAKIRLMYQKSLYQAGTVKVKINHYPKNIPKHLKRKTLVMLSAYNPGGRLKAEGWNQRMMQQLKAFLSDYKWVEGKGTLHDVSEPLLMVAMDPRKAKVLARKFRQNAIVLIRDQRYARLVFLA